MAEGDHNISDSHMQVKEKAEEEKLQKLESSGTTEVKSESIFDQIESWEAYEKGMLSKIEQSNRVHAKCMNNLTKESDAKRKQIRYLYLSEFYKKNGKIDPETNDNSAQMEDTDVEIGSNSSVYSVNEDIALKEVSSTDDDDSVQIILSEDITLIEINSTDDDDSVQIILSEDIALIEISSTDDDDSVQIILSEDIALKEGSSTDDDDSVQIILSEDIDLIEISSSDDDDSAR